MHVLSGRVFRNQFPVIRFALKHTRSIEALLTTWLQEDNTLDGGHPLGILHKPCVDIPFLALRDWLACVHVALVGGAVGECGRKDEGVAAPRLHAEAKEAEARLATGQRWLQINEQLCKALATACAELVQAEAVACDAGVRVLTLELADSVLCHCRHFESVRRHAKQSAGMLEERLDRGMRALCMRWPLELSAPLCACKATE
eukprot:6191622-Pleurochrysis_carterae.AAC.4